MEEEKKDIGNKRPLFNKLNSNLCIATVLGYLLTWEHTERFFCCLNKQNGKAYFNSHKAQYRHFINDRPVGPLSVTFGYKSFQYMRPKPFSRVEKLTLVNINQDLY